MANKKTTATVVAIAGMLFSLSAIANAAPDGGPQRPNFYEPK